MLRNIFTVLLVCLVLSGCGKSALDIKIRYDQIYDLDKGDRVIFEQNHIGKVTRISYLEDGYHLVEISIKSEFVKAATEHSKFFIIKDPRDAAKKAIEMIQVRRGGSLLQDGDTVDGSTRFSAVLNRIGEDLVKGLENTKKQFNQFLEDLKSLPESEQVKELERELDRLAKEMKRSSESVREKIQKEILPRLKEKLEELRESLKKLGREEEIEPLKVKLERLAD